MKYIAVVFKKNGMTEILNSPSLYHLRQEKRRRSGPDVESIRIVKPGQPMPLGLNVKIKRLFP